MDQKEVNNKPEENFRIFIVEDERLVAQEIASQIDNLGYGVCGIAYSEKDCHDKLSTEDPDLILMDIKLKGERSGIDLAKHYWNTRRIPSLYLSAYSDEETCSRAQVPGAYGFIVKPFHSRTLKAGIALALFRSKSDLELIQKRFQWKNELKKTLAELAQTDKNEDPNHKQTLLGSLRIQIDDTEMWRNWGLPLQRKVDSQTETEKARILIIEDDRAFQKVIERILAQFEVLVCDDAQTALRLLEKDQQFDLILCDVVLPGMDGVEFWTELKHRNASYAQRFAFMSGGSPTLEIREAINQGSTRFIQKPFSKKKLEEFILLCLSGNDI